MPNSGDRRTWFGLGGRPRLPGYLRAGTGAGKHRSRKRTALRPSTQTAMEKRIQSQALVSKRLKGLDEFQKPEFVGRMDRIAQRRKLEWWGLMLAGVVVGGAIGWFLL
jgi:hypothetical protein